ncbi:O-methyltransferase [Bacillus sp. EB01]|uniref:O-methyltransferase n=1 Tax=Bacillus sp. EB01 TaxID=1347086 RepID=UPI0005C6DA3B|nr:class I SAM-dependent methyltransferase [Bacillus sp. EB01]
MATTYRSNTYIPELVLDSKELAKRKNFVHSCSDEAGRLLSVLVGQIKQGKILEIGTGFGVGSSWLLSSIAPTVKFISVDHSIEKIDATANHIKHNQAEFICGDWKEVIPKGPFQFIFADAAAAKTIEGELLFDTLKIGGMLFMDDFTPEEHFPEEWRGKPDKVREYWLNHSGLRATEIYLTPTSSAILATRIK